MATVLSGQVFYQDTLAGELRRGAGGQCVFAYDRAYLEARKPAIAFKLPRQSLPYISEHGLHPFFDNLVAEGWLRNAQARAMRIDPDDRFALLLAFGRDCAGAVSVLDPAAAKDAMIDMDDPAVEAALVSRGSLSGVQPKILAVRDGRTYRPARWDETSTYIAKLPSGTPGDLVENEFLTTAATAALLPDDATAEVALAPLRGVTERALLVRRFDRLPSGTRLHFEEFNQLFGRRSGDGKYDAAYEDMGSFIRGTAGCTQVDAWRLYRRILACILTGNTDAHLKNFAMLHTPDGLRLTPAYDLVAAALYPEYQHLALSIAGARDLRVDRVKPKHLVLLGQGFGLSDAVIGKSVASLEGRRKTAATTLRSAASRIGADALGGRLLDLMERRWNGSFASIGRYMSKRPSDADAP